MRTRLIAVALRALVHRLVRRPADFVIGGGDPYMLRWYLIPRNRVFNVYRHIMLRSDDDRALHDHPWWSLSLCLDGALMEVCAGGRVRSVETGSVRFRRARDAHRLVLAKGQRCETLFVTGPKLREWGFHCPKGWRHWRDFVASDDSGSVGPGCE